MTSWDPLPLQPDWGKCGPAWMRIPARCMARQTAWFMRPPLSYFDRAKVTVSIFTVYDRSVYVYVMCVGQSRIPSYFIYIFIVLHISFRVLWVTSQRLSFGAWEMTACTPFISTSVTSSVCPDACQRSSHLHMAYPAQVTQSLTRFTTCEGPTRLILVTLSAQLPSTKDANVAYVHSVWRFLCFKRANFIGPRSSFMFNHAPLHHTFGCIKWNISVHLFSSV